MEDKIKKAKQLGAISFNSGIERSAYSDNEFMQSLVDESLSKDDHAVLVHSWYSGYDTASASNPNHNIN